MVIAPLALKVTVPGLKYGLGFLVYIDNGLLKMLEGYTYGEPWPEHIDAFTLSYSEPGRPKLFGALGR